ncbi:hypothetical protein AC477_00120 [miscellaneous Crenarchaeota group-1 archaeon SG8-32-1]|uniref:Exonuclease domain-containing protein n=1 Tax=miscellaneous Crenarchaeota group-1 archaeon SG8-32-1 TaxID=1685124 RepID=A0A0M0C1W4_9ARCH|nr:MAG: hypothetical protein AC477_00120 [miscellaneous Crenarchaeota group-1 archaeon SG8-32-1]
MIVAGIDLETSSLDTETCDITEIGVILWDPYRDKIIESISMLVEVDIEINNADITGIDNTLLGLYSWNPEYVREAILYRIDKVDYLMAHNAVFDQTILKRFMGSLLSSEKLWIDTMMDIPYLERIKTRSLSYLAVEHGFLNPFPHRALFDVMTMIKIASMYDFDEILKYTHSPNIWIRAAVSIDDRQLAKDRYFRWDPINKFWVKRIKEMNLQYEESKADFPIDLLPGYEYKEVYV